MARLSQMHHIQQLFSNQKTLNSKQIVNIIIYQKP